MYPSPQLGPHVLAGGLAIVLSFATLAIAPAAMVLAPYHHPPVASPSWPQEGRATAAAGPRAERDACGPSRSSAHHESAGNAPCEQGRLARNVVPL